jgi:hypothetical protein
MLHDFASYLRALRGLRGEIDPERSEGKTCFMFVHHEEHEGHEGNTIG